MGGEFTPARRQVLGHRSRHSIGSPLRPGICAPDTAGKILGEAKGQEEDERCACTAPEEWVADLEGEGESSSTRSIELLSFHQYGSIGLCVRHVNMLAALFGLKTPIEPKEQVRRLARLWAERKRGHGPQAVHAQDGHVVGLGSAADWVGG